MAIAEFTTAAYSQGDGDRRPHILHPSVRGRLKAEAVAAGRGRVWRRAALVGAGLALGLLLAELALHHSRGCLARILETSPHLGLRYGLRPRSRGRFHGIEMRINALGLRGPMPRTVEERILMVGDSHIFGLAAEEDETIPAFLERLLGGSTAVLNGGTPGYNIFQTADWLRLRAGELAPDTVLWVLNWGDFEPSGMGLEMRPRTVLTAWLTRSCLIRGVLRRLGREDLVIAPAPAMPPLSERFAAAFGLMAEIALWAREAEIALEVILLPAPHDWSDYPGAPTHALLADAARQAGLPVSDLLDTLRHEDATPYRAANSWHANGRGNRRYAEAILARDSGKHR